MKDEQDPPYEVIITPPRKFSFNFVELWKYRELFYFFAWRDIKVKYKQTILGVLWVLLQPVLTVLIFSLFFGRALQVPSDGIPYPVFVFSGLMLWNLFSSGVLNGGNSMISNAQIIKKIYFPRLIIPFSAILISLFDFLVSFAVFVVVLIVYGIHVDPLLAMLYWPASLFLTVIGALGSGVLLSALNVKYRDFKYLIPFFIQVLLFLTPVIYPISIIAEKRIHYLLALNPVYGAITLFRVPLAGVLTDPALIQISMVSSGLTVLLGVYYFRKTEDFFADLA